MPECVLLECLIEIHEDCLIETSEIMIDRVSWEMSWRMSWRAFDRESRRKSLRKSRRLYHYSRFSCHYLIKLIIMTFELQISYSEKNSFFLSIWISKSETKTEFTRVKSHFELYLSMQSFKIWKNRLVECRKIWSTTWRIAKFRTIKIWRSKAKLSSINRTTRILNFEQWIHILCRLSSKCYVLFAMMNLFFDFNSEFYHINLCQRMSWTIDTINKEDWYYDYCLKWFDEQLEWLW